MGFACNNFPAGLLTYSELRCLSVRFWQITFVTCIGLCCAKETDWSFAFFGDGHISCAKETDWSFAFFGDSHIKDSLHKYQGS